MARIKLHPAPRTKGGRSSGALIGDRRSCESLGRMCDFPEAERS